MIQGKENPAERDWFIESFIPQAVSALVWQLLWKALGSRNLQFSGRKSELASFSAEGQEVGVLSLVSRMVSLQPFHSALVAEEQLRVIRNWMGTAVFRQNFIYENKCVGVLVHGLGIPWIESEES